MSADDVQASDLIETLRAELKKIKDMAREGYHGSWVYSMKMADVLGKAIVIAKDKGISAYDLSIAFTEACLSERISLVEDAWFERSLCYGEIRFCHPPAGHDILSRWGEL